MYIILEIEVKIDGRDNKLEYIDDNVRVSYKSKNEAIKKLNEKIDKTIANGYFTEIYFRNEKRAILRNGGTAYKQFSIIQIKEDQIYE